MNIFVKRIAKLPTYTIGKLFINNKYQMDVLEDPDRGLRQDMTLEEIKKRKIYGDTAIPTGTYNITLDVVSPKFKDKIWAKPYDGKIPRLLNVPGFEGVLLHPGNTASDSYGCLLVGENKVKGQVINSQSTFHRLMDMLLNVRNEEITITIV